MGHGDAGVGGRRDAGGDPGHDLEGDLGGDERLGLLAAAAEDERVAALQPHDARPGAGAVDEQVLDLALLDRRVAGLLADVEELGVVADAVERAGRDQAVVEDDVGARQELERARRHQARVPWPGADEIDDPSAGSATHAIISACFRMFAAPALSSCSASRRPSVPG